ncbi:MAG TPA: SRPBCC domain-containing protein [Streptosporangiaceae bacterium]|nr:SRPBCC domain-containing protein [Streptosporangiaceae bacterium]
MTSNAAAGNRIVGTLRIEHGKGVVRMEDRIGTDIDDLWSAFTDPGRLARWLGEFEGDLRLGGEFRARFFDGWEGTGRVDACVPPRHLLVVTRHVRQADEHAIEATLTADGGDHTILILEERGMPVNLLAAYGAGIQVHIENLAAHINGQERCDTEARWNELQPAYQDLAASIS